MTGRITGGSAPKRGAKDLSPIYRGSNQTGLRAANERLVLSLIRIHGELAKSQIAELTGLTAQTASVIVRALEAEGLVTAGSPLRGKVGQPSVPMSLNPGGALFFGLRIGRQSAELALVDFRGRVLAELHRSYVHPHPDVIAAFAQPGIAELKSGLSAEQASRLQGIGIAASAHMHAERTMQANGRIQENWEPIDRLATRIGDPLGVPVYVHSEASAACSAELIYGLGGGISDFLYIHIGDALGSGIVQQGKLDLSRRTTLKGINRMLVPGPAGALCLLGDLAAFPDRSLSIDPFSWQQANGETVQRWIEDLARGIAHAITAASSIIAFDAVIIDGFLPRIVRSRIVREVQQFLSRLEHADVDSHIVREGTIQRETLALGAACLPLLDRFFL